MSDSLEATRILLERQLRARSAFLDWTLAFAIAACVIWLMRAQLIARLETGHAHRHGMQPNQDTDTIDAGGAAAGAAPLALLYNVPSTRMLPLRRMPSGSAPPSDPSAPPSF